LKRATLTIVGVGPGDPELITVKGLRAIQAANVIFVPRSRNNEESFALRIAQQWLDHSRQKVVSVALAMSRDKNESHAAWQKVADQIAENLAEIEDHQQEAHGVYLLLGDSMLYSTFTYIQTELLLRHSQIKMQFIPGITSFAATAAQAQVSLAQADEKIIIVPASEQIDSRQLRSLLTDFETVILMKVGTVLPQIIKLLEELESQERVIFAEKVGMPEEYITQDLAALREKQHSYLSLLIVQQKK
jgi:precorrin-2/cobalt-factor-2 C20-methyltransferase